MGKNPVVRLKGKGHLGPDHSKRFAIWMAIAPISVSGNMAIAQPGDGTDMRGKETGERARQDTDLSSVEEVVNLPTVEVIGTEERLKEIPGSGFIIPQETLYKSHVFTVNEALRKVPGVNVRDEEGFGIRPNIGIRGQNPTRSTKTLLLEDGLPLSFAPYGDNASYFHPPVDRFERIEVLKGAGQILFGPQTTSGTINYITPTPPLKPQGFLGFTGGSRDYYNVHANYGGTWNKLGGLLDYIHRQSDGSRDNTHFDINDVNLKGLLNINERNALILRGNYFGEDSQVGYSGITEAELRNFGIRYNPFKNDEFDADRWGASATHELYFNDDLTLTTSFYWSHFHRDWWRQSSRTTDTQCDATLINGLTFSEARQAGLAVNVDACNSVQGRLRDYYTWGFEPRLHAAYDFLGIPSEVDLGFRAHYEEQFRVQENGSSPTARGGTRTEDNERFADAYAGFIQNRFILGRWTVTPGVRVESVDFERRNLLPGSEAQGESDVTEPLPAFGITYNPVDAATLFFGFHRGFSPPRVEDVISNQGNSVEVEPEKSWNYELGVRSQPWRGVQLDATLFRNDFSSNTVVGSVAGGDLPLAQGEALYQGTELFGRLDLGELLNSPHNFYAQIAWTWLGDAEQESPFVCPLVDGAVPTRTDPQGVPFCDPVTRELLGSGDGRRVPYAPEHLITAMVGYSHPIGFDINLETVFVDSQFSDFPNTVTPDPSGMTGEIEDYTIFNLATTYRVKPLNMDVFAAVKNLFDNEYIADRTRGIVPGTPQLVQAGLRIYF
jgi:Fe(3+) dicitrate transport protein